jgi:hypothetical protein
MGVPNEYVVEFFAPNLEGYEVFHNLDDDEDDFAEDEVEPNGQASQARARG